MLNESEMKSAYKKFWAQRENAVRREIDFLFTFKDWMDFWLESGHWHERGRKRGQYVMSRIGDVGPYSRENCFIQTCSGNHRDAHLGKVASEETKQKLRATFAQPEVKKKMSAANRGKLKSEETKQKLRATFAQPEVKKKMSAENNSMCKLSREQCAEILSSPLGRKELAELYCQSKTTIALIKTGKHWSSKLTS